MKYFLSCDWGTSSFRLRLIDATSCAVLAETLSKQGISETYKLWHEHNKIERLAFYQSFLLQQLSFLQHKHEKISSDLPLIVSGMAASAIGMYELPYKQIPVASLEKELLTYTIHVTKDFPFKTILISGLKTDNDVMRGEETMLAGCDFIPSKNEQLYIFPGTHSKHVIIKDGNIKDFKTYMTGEMFQLLNTKSLLANSIDKSNSDEHFEYFMQGVKDAQQINFLNSIFYVRTNTLLNKLNTSENYSYLSGLVIGEELKSLANNEYEKINLVSSGSLMKLYTTALGIVETKNKLIAIDADDVLIRGQYKILKYIQ